MPKNAFHIGQSEVQRLVSDQIVFSENLFIKRDDLIHPVVSGNKWRKLKYHIDTAQKLGKTHLVSFGGAFSNHMAALACSGAVLGLKTSCFIRGDEFESKSNHFLFLAQLYGMQLIPVERELYKSHKSELFHTHFGSDEQALMIEEGGAGDEGERGVSELIFELPFVPDHIVHASATATTAAGLIKGLMNRKGFEKTRVHSMAVLKNGAEQTSKLQLLESEIDWLVHEADMGGYAKYNPQLLRFIEAFTANTGILIDPVYTGKALYGINELMRDGTINSTETVVFLHTGGMLGLFSDYYVNAFGKK